MQWTMLVRRPSNCCYWALITTVPCLRAVFKLVTSAMSSPLEVCSENSFVRSHAPSSATETSCTRPSQMTVSCLLSFRRNNSFFHYQMSLSEFAHVYPLNLTFKYERNRLTVCTTFQKGSGARDMSRIHHGGQHT